MYVMCLGTCIFAIRGHAPRIGEPTSQGRLHSLGSKARETAARVSAALWPQTVFNFSGPLRALSAVSTYIILDMKMMTCEDGYV